MPDCIDQATLLAFAAGQLPDEAARQIEAHLETCRRCAERSANLPEDEELVRHLRELEQSRAELAPLLSSLKDVQERVTTTLFGPNSGQPGDRDESSKRPRRH